ncbi:MAG: hypothetical protein NXH75_03390 [Halobacteriovoraceae bacterium]|nr:hypothetical protein [Halobacteriovoraceae bacterium]
MVRWLFIFLFSFSLFANEDLEKVVTLAEDVRDTVIEVERNEGNLSDDPEFVLDEKTSDFVLNLQEMDKEVASIVPESLIDSENRAPQAEDPCDDHYSVSEEVAERIKGRKFKIYFTATFSDQADIGLNPGFAGRNNYRNFMTYSSQNGHPDAYDIRSIGSLESKYLRQEKPTDWDSLSMVERGQRLHSFAQSFSGAEPSLGLILSEYAIKDMTANPSDWKSSLNEIKDHLSFDEKLKIASHFGGRFSDNYNSDRANGTGPRANGIVTIEEMLESVRDGVDGGVCRDVSQAQSLMLQELGVDKKDIYQTSYMTATAGHVVLAVKDPDNPKRIVKINYDYTDETDDRSGGSALTQNSSLPDFGHQWRIYDADGKPVGTVPSEFGEVLRDATRGRELSDGISRRHNLQRVYVDTPIGVGSIFTGTTTSGDNIVGVAVTNKAEEERTGSNFHYGIAAVRREGDRAVVKIEQNALYSFMKYTYNTPRYERGNFSIGARGGSDSEITLMDNTALYDSGREKSGVNIDSRVGLHYGADIKYASDDNRTRVTSGLTFEHYVASQNEQEGPKGGLTLARDRIVWSTAVERDITPDMMIAGESAIVFRDIGNTAAFKGVVVDKSSQFGGTITYQTPLEDVPAFNPMSSESVGLGVIKSWGRDGAKVRPSFRMDYVRDLDFDSNGLQAEFGIKF